MRYISVVLLAIAVIVVNPNNAKPADWFAPVQCEVIERNGQLYAINCVCCGVE